VYADALKEALLGYFGCYTDDCGAAGYNTYFIQRNPWVYGILGESRHMCADPGNMFSCSLL